MLALLPDAGSVPDNDVCALRRSAWMWPHDTDDRSISPQAGMRSFVEARDVPARDRVVVKHGDLRSEISLLTTTNRTAAVTRTDCATLRRGVPPAGCRRWPLGVPRRKRTAVLRSASPCAGAGRRAWRGGGADPAISTLVASDADHRAILLGKG